MGAHCHGTKYFHHQLVYRTDQFVADKCSLFTLKWIREDFSYHCGKPHLKRRFGNIYMMNIKLYDFLSVKYITKIFMTFVTNTYLTC